MLISWRVKILDVKLHEKFLCHNLLNEQIDHFAKILSMNACRKEIYKICPQDISAS